jgi:hypothetical protein
VFVQQGSVAAGSNDVQHQRQAAGAGQEQVDPLGRRLLIEVCAATTRARPST